jgi:uncharacterized protein YjeT (DUF2065 family)
MSEWWTYRPSDFLMFSPRTYSRLFELTNTELWPLQIVALAAGIAILWLVWRGAYGRAVAAVLAAAWTFVAWAYHFERYAAINTGALYYAAGFAIQAMLLVWCTVRRDGLRFELQPAPVRWVGLVLLAVGVVLYPLLAPLLGRPWTQAEVFAIAPDPTAVATIGLILLAKGRIAFLLALPLLWCTVTALTLWTMQAPDAAVPASALLLGPGAAIWRWRAAGPKCRSRRA